MKVSPPTVALGFDADLLAGRAEEAIAQGSELAAWCRGRHEGNHAGPPAFPLSLHRTYRLRHRAEGYFGLAQIGDGPPASVMGCRQFIALSPHAPAAGEDVLCFMKNEFLRAARWERLNGQPGGFTITPQLCRNSRGGEVTLYPPRGLPGSHGNFDWSSLGREWDWVLLRVELHEFVLRFGPFERRLRQAAFVAASPAFFRIETRPAQPLYDLSITIGYPFVRVAPYRNYFGFGPGKFTTAIKLFTMHLRRDRQVEMEMEFAAAPRCEKVLDLGPRWPDPVYGSAALGERLTAGRWKSQPFRDRLDAGMLAQHCRVHLALIEGIDTAWGRWIEGRGVRQGVGQTA